MAALRSEPLARPFLCHYLPQTTPNKGPSNAIKLFLEATWNNTNYNLHEKRPLITKSKVNKKEDND